MAAALHIQTPRDNFREEFLTCSLCCEQYDNHDHVAKGLPCLHTFCRKCLIAHAQGSNLLHCPNCKKQVGLSAPGDVDSVPTNFHVEHLRIYKNMIGLPTPCDNCDEMNNHAVKFCNDCGCNLCQTCLNAHTKMLSLRLHVIVECQDSQPSQATPAGLTTELARSMDKPPSNKIEGKQVVDLESDRLRRKITPSLIDLKNCSLKFGIAITGCHGQLKATLYTVDSQRQMLPSGGADVKVTQHWRDGSKRICPVKDNDDGTYTIVYGYTPSIFTVSINGKPFLNEGKDWARP